MAESLFQVCNKNSRIVEISTPFNVIEHKVDNNIVKLECGDTIIKVGEYFKVKLHNYSNKYKVRSIKKKGEGLYSLVSYHRNKTTQYLLPMLRLTQEKLFYNSFFINAYLQLNKKHDLNGKFIYLTYRFVRGDEYRQAEKLIKTYPNYYKTIDVSPNLVVYAFIIPQQYYSDVELFKEGKYSRFSLSLKGLISMFNGKLSIPSKVVNKELSYLQEIEEYFDVTLPKEMELDRIPNMNEETLEDYD